MLSVEITNKRTLMVFIEFVTVTKEFHMDELW